MGGGEEFDFISISFLVFSRLLCSVKERHSSLVPYQTSLGYIHRCVSLGLMYNLVCLNNYHSCYSLQVLRGFRMT